MQYMNPLVPEDLDALNELAKLTWTWSVHYWTERGLSHGSFYIYFRNPKNNTQERVDGFTISEAVNKAIIIINTIGTSELQIQDYP